jgi:GH25 family lysozyme M1 (1,4-beta-N-acetylmuramidase)
MDLVAARAAGIDFFTHKATEGSSVRHIHYGEALSRARNAGVPFLGAYHVVRSSPSIASQVDYLLAYADQATPWWRTFPGWFWQCDLELWPYDPVSAQRGVDFSNALATRTGKAVLLYASRGQYGDQLRGADHPLWNANYGTNDAQGFKALYAARGGDTGTGWTAYSGVAPRIWQYGSRAIIGRQSTCDANAFRGTLADFQHMIGVDDMQFSDQIPDLPGVTVGTFLRDAYPWLAEMRGLALGAEAGEVRTDDRFKDKTFLGALMAAVKAQSVPPAAPLDQDALDGAVARALARPEVLAAIATAVADENARRQQA